MSQARLTTTEHVSEKLLHADERPAGDDQHADDAVTTTAARLRADSAMPLADPDDPVEEEEAKAACCCVKWKYPWILGAYMFISAIPVMLTRPLLVDVQKDYFGSDSKAAMYSSVIQSIVAFINLFLIVAYGRLLDSIGRKPFFIAAASAQVVCYVSLAAFSSTPIIFMIVQGATGLIQGSYSGAFLADMVAPENRSYAFTIVSAVAIMSMIASLPIAIFKFSNMTYYLTSIAFAIISLLFVIFIIPESLPKHNRKPFQLKGTFGNPLAGAAILLKSKAMMIIAATACVLATADVGTQDVYMYYLNQRVGFTKADNSYFFVEMALMSLLGFFVITPILLKYVSTITVLCLALSANAALLLLVATVWARWCVFAFLAPMYGLLVMGGPILNTIITNIGHERDVGKRITAMTAVSDFCNALGPLVFGVLYGELPAGLIAMPFFIFGGLIMVTVCLLWFRLGNAIRDDQATVQEELRAEALARGEEGGGEDGADINDPNSPVGAGRALYNDEDVCN